MTTRRLPDPPMDIDPKVRAYLTLLNRVIQANLQDIATQAGSGWKVTSGYTALRELNHATDDLSAVKRQLSTMVQDFMDRSKLG